MEQILVADLQHSTLPHRLPDRSGLKVWVRSTGYEVRFLQNKPSKHPLYWLVAAILATVMSFFLVQALSAYAPVNYIAWALPVLVAVAYLLQGISRGQSKVRLDVNPMTIAISYLGTGDRPEAQEHLPLKEIESFYIDDARGLGLNINISEILHRTWIGAGLARDDLQYLAMLIVQSGKLSMQHPHPGSR